MQRAILGIDCGTSKIAAVLIDPDNQAVLATRSAETLADIPGNPPSRKEQDVATTASVFGRVVTEILSSRKVRLSSIGLTGQAHGIVGLDEKGNPLTPYVTWEDGRGEEVSGSGHTFLREIRERTGGSRPLATGYGIVTLYHWMQQGLPGGVSRICGIVDYLGSLLTEDPIPVTDYTMAETFGMFEVVDSCWDKELLDTLNIPASLLPRLSAPTEVAGMLRAPWLLEHSNNREVPVCVTLGDNQAGYLASARHPFESVLINIGTGSQISLAVHPDSVDDLAGSIDGYDVTLRPFVDSSFLIAGSALSGGTAYRALMRFFASVGKELFEIDESPDLYERMQILAEQAGGSRGLRVEPLLSGSRSKPASRGSVQGLSFDNLEPGPLVYGMLEGIIGILKNLIEPHLLEERKYLIGSGNGLRRNPLLRRITAAMFQRELLIPCIEEEAAVGAALNSAVAAGVYSGFEEARKLIQYEAGTH